MSVFQAAFIALFYTYARSAFNAGLGGYVLSQPLVAGTIVGLLLGDPLSGAALGGTINLATLALSNLRIRFGPDEALIGYVGVSLMLLAGVQVGSANAALIFTALAGVGLALNFLRGAANSLLAHWADFFAERGDATAVGFINVAPTQVWLIAVAFLPAFVLLRFNINTVLNLSAAIPSWLQSALTLSQQLLAALGIAMAMRLLMRGSSMAYFLLGWLGAQLFGLVPVTLLGACVATLHAVADSTHRDEQSRESAGEVKIDDKSVTGVPQPLTIDTGLETNPPHLTSGDLRASLLLWVFFHDAGLNFERAQNMGLATALAPIATRLYADAQQRAACLRRHLTLFTTEFSAGAALVGASAGLEERRVAGDSISDAELIGVKTSLMSGIGVIGDVVMGGLVTALGVAGGTALVRQHSLLGPFLFVVFEAIVVLSVAAASFRLGYVGVRHAVERASLNGWYREALSGAHRLGVLILGALVISLVPIGLPATAVIHIDAAQIPLQSTLLDSIMPHLAPLLITLGLGWLIYRRGTHPMVLLGALILLAFVACGILRFLNWL